VKEFSNILFEEQSHTYTVRGVKYTPVSTVISKAKTPFDKEKQLVSSSKKTGKTVNELREEWDFKKDFGCTRGTNFHSYVENYYTKSNLPVDDTYIKNQIKQFQVFEKQNSKTYSLVEAECIVYDVESKVAGTFDALFQDTKGNLSIFDWKTNSDLSLDNRWQNFLGKLSHLQQSDYNAYSLQLSLYKYMIEKNTDLKIKDLKIVYFPPEQHTHYVYTCPYLLEEVKILLDLASK